VGSEADEILDERLRLHEGPYLSSPGRFYPGKLVEAPGSRLLQLTAFSTRSRSWPDRHLLGQADGKTTGTTLRAQGFYAQAGYCIIPKTLEAAVRFSYVDFNRDAANDLQIDTQGALSYYFNKHNLKLQGDVTNSHIQRPTGPTGPTDDMIYRLQAQVIF